MLDACTNAVITPVVPTALFSYDMRSGTQLNTVDENWVTTKSTYCSITYTFLDTGTSAFPDSSVFSVVGGYL
jgi:hypothetical protein